MGLDSTVTLLVSGHPTVPTHVGLLAQTEGNETGAGLALAASAIMVIFRDREISRRYGNLQFDMLGGEDVVHVDMELGASLLELALLSSLSINIIVTFSKVLCDIKPGVG